MKKMIHRQMVNGMEQMMINTDTKLCKKCIYGKQTKSSFPQNKRARSHRVLELIHTDVCGPIIQPAWDKSRYFVTFMDDFSRASMVYCIERKSQVLEKFKEFGCKVAKLRADNGGEYTSHEFKNFCKQKGIQLLYTVPYNPEMNSVGERLNRTLQEKARTMLLASGIDWCFWNEDVIVANYLRNREVQQMHLANSSSAKHRLKYGMAENRIYPILKFLDQYVIIIFLWTTEKN